MLGPGKPQQFLYCSILVPHPPSEPNATFMAQIQKYLCDGMAAQARWALAALSAAATLLLLGAMVSLGGPVPPPTPPPAPPPALRPISPAPAAADAATNSPPTAGSKAAGAVGAASHGVVSGRAASAGEGGDRVAAKVPRRTFRCGNSGRPTGDR
eukprot:gene3858-biopygen6211